MQYRGLPRPRTRTVTPSSSWISVPAAWPSRSSTPGRLQIDQGHKFSNTLNDIIAVDGGAIAAKWKSHYRQPGYDYREDHKERDGNYYAIRGSWAMEKGLMNKGEGYTDDMTMPGEEIFCRCGYTYIYSLRKIPEEMLTSKGKAHIHARD